MKQLQYSSKSDEPAKGYRTYVCSERCFGAVLILVLEISRCSFVFIKLGMLIQAYQFGCNLMHELPMTVGHSTFVCRT